MKREPVAVLVAVATVLLAALSALAGTGVLSGRAAAVVAAAVAALNLVLGVVTRGAVTPVADPRSNTGEPLVPRPGGPA